MNAQNYGFAFNDIVINDSSVTKTAKNSVGKIKINNEIEFYLYIIKNNIDFPIPKLLYHNDGELKIQYIKNSDTMTNIITNLNTNCYIGRIKELLNTIHSVKLPVHREILLKDLIIETYKKPIERFNEFNWSKNEIYASIHSVNNIKIKNIHHYCEIIKTKIIDYIKDREYYNLIHGDVHLGNILITPSGKENETSLTFSSGLVADKKNLRDENLPEILSGRCNKNDELYFIDPRGYFGESKLFGVSEYDYAKLMFGLSGYSVFDNMVINDLCIENNNITINFIKDYEHIFENKIFDDLTILFCLSIWLANNSCFLDINKKITSLMIAYYYCEKYI